MADAEEVFGCITPATARFMRWEPPKSVNEYKAHREARLQAGDQSVFSFVIRRSDTMECLGIAGLDEADQPTPELGIWPKEAAHGHGYGTEATRNWLTPSGEINTGSRHGGRNPGSNSSPGAVPLCPRQLHSGRQTGSDNSRY